MFFSTITVLLLSVFYILAWQEKPAHPPVLTRRNQR
jgi:hypothetical protein